MASSLLDRSLDDISRQQQPRRGSGRPSRGRVSSEGQGGRSSPYSKPAPRNVAADPDSQWQHDLFKTDKLDYGGEGDESGAARGAAPRRRDNNGNEARTTRLKITNLHYEVSEAELEALFLQVGTLAPATARETNPAIKTTLGNTFAYDASYGPLSRPFSNYRQKFDISGRSMGEAYVTYESEADAARAKEVFNNALAKGERISIEYDFRGPPRPRRNEATDGASGWKTSIPSGGLGGGNLNKGIGGGSANSLLARMDRSQVPPASATQPAGNRAPFNSSAGRAPSSGSGRGAPRGSPRGSVPRGGRGGGGAPTGRGRGTGRIAGGGSSREAKTAEDLDRELEEFMAKGSSNDTTTPAPAAVGEDVEMA